jgi:hypothetical protein
MKMKKIITAIFFISAFISLGTSCGKKKGCTDPNAVNYDKDAEENDNSCIYKGCTDPKSSNYNSSASIDDGTCEYLWKGGSLTIVAFPEHHGAPIPSLASHPDTAFIKSNTSNFPGLNPNLYDTFFVGLTGDDFVRIEGIKKGNYFIFMTGYDANIFERVVGGIPYTLTIDTGSVDVVVPVTE